MCVCVVCVFTGLCSRVEVCVTGMCSRVEVCVTGMSSRVEVCVTGMCSRVKVCVTGLCRRVEVCVKGMCSRVEVCFTGMCSRVEVSSFLMASPSRGICSIFPLWANRRRAPGATGMTSGLGTGPAVGGAMAWSIPGGQAANNRRGEGLNACCIRIQGSVVMVTDVGYGGCQGCT